MDTTLARHGLIWLGAFFLLSACAVKTGVAPTQAPPSAAGDKAVISAPLDDQNEARNPAAPGPPGASPVGPAQLYPGTGRFIRQAGRAPAGAVADGEDAVTLNFIDAAIDEVAAAILGDLLKVNYTIEPGVTGRVTIQTSQPIARESLLPTLEALLGLNGAAIVDADGLYKVVSLTSARRAGAPVRSLPPSGPRARGYAVEVVPLHFIAAGEMEKILETLALKENILRADAVRNVLILAGTEQELQSLNEAIEIFDVDWLSGMSFGLFPIKFSNAKAVGEELEKIFLQAGGEAQAQLVQFVPIERLNTILVVTQRQDFLEQVKLWIERLDRKGDGNDRRIFVYSVQNARAESLAASLTEIFGGDEADKAVSTGLAPGQLPVAIGSPPTGGATAAPGGAPGQADRPGQDATPPGAGTAGEGIVLPTSGTIRVIADNDHNALIVLATPREYEMVEATLRKLDIVPLQVLIQASIFEVTLTDDLSYGIRWFFERGKSSLLLDNLPAVTGGFSYAFSSANITAAIDALASITELKLVSSPELLVLDNQTASLQVGDQVPVATRQSQSVTDPDAPVVSSIQFRNTGTILRVTPRVNAGGMVTMEVEQEVSDVTPSAAPTVTPTIFQRTISSTIAVMSGESVALGGLISESIRDARSGVPILSDIPILGALFRSTTEETRRTELLVLITPRVVRNQVEAEMVTEEIRRRMGRVERYIREKEVLRDRDTPAGSAAAGAADTATKGHTVGPGAIPEKLPAQADPAAAANRQAKTVPIESRMLGAQVGAADRAAEVLRPPAYFVHLSSHRTAAGAAREWQELSQMYPEILRSLQPAIQRTDLGERGIYFRLKAGPIEDKSSARALCRQFEAHDQYCQVLGG